MKPSDDSIEFGLICKLHKAVFLLTKVADKELSTTTSLSRSHFMILSVLQCASDIAQVRIADILGITEAAVSRQMELLSKKGLINRDSGEKPKKIRSMPILTIEGIAELEKAKHHMEEVSQTLFSKIDTHSLKIFDESLEKILSVLGENYKDTDIILDQHEKNSCI